ncbi:hypothetical protein NBRC10512_002225 [Rhodotorula toruloides]|uniref:RHTO0S02e10088g1_1 n=2 Tax=Rhodotorula toruloides TaxID=5286 RepID=A0A061AQQ1_RHOTO|nr:uncharacterized protein RHTO_07327 [Rhodotorula toruloides NP11]EMS23593.1 hypothetical protein RHTO_07327 [Rhodotorula toruloides NP11]CDR37041.1 RHTO0S02e10088g1_1 [Rhodotorula toruloides]
MASFSPNTLFDPDERLDCARYFLDKAAHGGQAELQELAAFLLLLEVVAWLQVQTVAGGRLLGGEGEQETEKETDKRAAGGLATGQDVEGVRTALGGTNEGGVSGSAGADATSAEWKTRTKYLTAVYLGQPQSAESPVLQPPLAPPSNSGALLHDVCSCARPARESLLSLVDVGLDSLNTSTLPQPSASPPSSQLAANVLVNRLPSSTLPPPLPSSTMSSLTGSLTSPAIKRSDASRRTLSTILGHYVSSKSFGVHDVVEEGKVWYAQDSQDDERIKRIYPSSGAATSSVSAVASDASEDEDADTRSIATGIREAQESIARKDKKLEWLLGNNFQKGCNRSDPPASTSTPKRWRSTTTPTSSFGLSSSSTIRGDPAPIAPPVSRTRETSYESAGSNDATSRHSRMVSRSSTAPLLARRSKDTLEPALEPAIEGEPMLADAVADVKITDDSEKPFADLAPALPHSASSNRPPLSPRRSSLDSSLDQHLGTVPERSRRAAPPPPLNKNALSANQKRELVRRSKKLEGFFGASFHEDAARKVLVEARTSTSGQSEVSPTTATFARQEFANSAQGGRRDSLAPPTAGWAGPTPGYSFGAYRRPSLLSNSSSHSSIHLAASARGSTGSASPLASPRSPTFPTAPRMQRSSSSPSRRSSSFSSMTSPEYAYFSAEPRRPSTLEREEQQRLREERRKKLEKVTRLLGERVPAQLVVGKQQGALEASKTEIGGATMTRSRSKGGMGGRLKGRLGFGGHHGHASSDKPGEGGNVGWDYVQPQWTAPTDQVDGGDTVRTAGSAVDALTKARKLENLFGDLPPPSLYLAPAPPTSSSHPHRPLHTFRHRRSVSDITASYSPFSPHATAGGWAPKPPPNAPLSRAQTRSTVNSLRQSIASLSYAMERDPAALDEVVRAYASSSEDDLSTPHAALFDPSLSGDEAESFHTQDAPVMTRSASAQSHRAVKQAHKLSHFFGTTRGEVWRMLLDDIQASVLEDETVDEDERAELVSNLDRLREKV